MSEEMGRESEEQRARRRATSNERQPERKQGAQANHAENPHYSNALLRDASIGGRGNASVRSSAMRTMQSNHGNRAVQRFLQGGATMAGPGEDVQLARQIETLSGSGGKLPAGVQAQLEKGMGADLSGVRVHTGAEADHLARSMNAVAFTTGSDIFFREGAYNPGNQEGLKLLAHETTHTIQQAAGPVEGTPSAGGVSISDPADSFEQEAERTAEAVVSGRQGDVAGEKSTQGASTGTSIQRFVEPTPWMNASPFIEPTPWAGHGGRSSGWNGMPSGPNLGIEPANPGAGWMQSPHTPSPTGGGYDPAFDPFYNPTPMPGPNLGTEPANPGGGWMQSPHTPGPQIDNPAFPGGSPFFNPTPSMPVPTGGADDPAFNPFFNPTPQVPTPTGDTDDPGFFPFHNPTFDFPSGSKIGWEPAKKGEPNSPWAYFKDNGKKGYDRGLDGGFGLFHGEGEIGGVPVTDDILTGQFKLGGWDNGQDGMRHGISGSAGVAKMGFNNGGFVSGDAEAFTAAAEASWGDDGANSGRTGHPRRWLDDPRWRPY